MGVQGGDISKMTDIASGGSIKGRKGQQKQGGYKGKKNKCKIINTILKSFCNVIPNLMY